MTDHTPDQLHLTAGDAETLRRAAVAAFPEECCGFLVGEGYRLITVTAVVPAANKADDLRRAFAIDPQAQFDLLRRTRENGRRVVGHYHSHPECGVPPLNELGALPSSHDLAMAYDPDAVWVVLAATALGASPPRAFRHPLGAASFVEVPIVISPTEPHLVSMGNP